MAAYGPAEGRDSRPRGDGDEELLELIRQLPGDDPERRKACEIIVGRYANIVQPCVSGEIKRHFRDKRWQIRVQRSVQELRLRIRAAVPDLTHQLSRPPTDAELAAHLGVTEADVTAAQLASQVFQIASLDAPVGADGSGDTAGDLLGAEDPELEHALDMEAVWTHYEELPAREQRLLMMRFYGNMTQAQIGQQLGMSQMHVSRLLGRALAYLREKITGLSEPLSE
jgi:RNA polymerase sigma-B factor